MARYQELPASMDFYTAAMDHIRGDQYNVNEMSGTYAL